MALPNVGHLVGDAVAASPSLSPHAPPVRADHACHASVQVRVTGRARCTTRCAACSLSAPVPSLAPVPCVSPFVCPLCPSSALSSLSHTRTVHSNLWGTCSLLRFPACPHPPHPAFWLCPASHSLLSAHGAEQRAWHPRSLSSLPLAAFAPWVSFSLAALPSPSPAFFPRVTLQGTMHAICKHLERHAPCPPALPLVPAACAAKEASRCGCPPQPQPPQEPLP